MTWIHRAHNGRPPTRFSDTGGKKDEIAKAQNEIEEANDLVPTPAPLQTGDLHDIALPPNLTEIEAAAFYGCTSLSEITLPPNLTEIGGSQHNGPLRGPRLPVSPSPRLPVSLSPTLHTWICCRCAAAVLRSIHALAMSLSFAD